MAVLSWLFFKSLFIVSLFRSTNIVKKVSDLFLLLKQKLLWSPAKLCNLKDLRLYLLLHIFSFLLAFLFFKDLNTFIDPLEALGLYAVWFLSQSENVQKLSNELISRNQH